MCYKFQDGSYTKNPGLSGVTSIVHKAEGQRSKVIVSQPQWLLVSVSNRNRIFNFYKVVQKVRRLLFGPRYIFISRWV